MLRLVGDLERPPLKPNLYLWLFGAIVFLRAYSPYGLISDDFSGEYSIVRSGISVIVRMPLKLLVLPSLCGVSSLISSFKYLSGLISVDTGFPSCSAVIGSTDN